MRGWGVGGQLLFKNWNKTKWILPRPSPSLSGVFGVCFWGFWLWSFAWWLLIVTRVKGSCCQLADTLVTYSDPHLLIWVAAVHCGSFPFASLCQGLDSVQLLAKVCGAWEGPVSYPIAGPDTCRMGRTPSLWGCMNTGSMSCAGCLGGNAPSTSKGLSSE